MEREEDRETGKIETAREGEGAGWRGRKTGRQSEGKKESQREGERRGEEGRGAERGAGGT